MRLRNSLAIAPVNRMRGPYLDFSLKPAQFPIKTSTVEPSPLFISKKREGKQ